MAHSVFISYRREDTADAAGRIYDSLIRRFGKRRIFEDVYDLPPGSDFAQVIRRALPHCRVFLALIGPSWLEAHTEGGESRLEDQNDLVRVEIELALAANLDVVPVLVNGASMPRADRLPESLRPLVTRQAAEVRRGRDFPDDLARLADAIKQSLRTSIFDFAFLGAPHDPKVQKVWMYRHARAVSVQPNAPFRVDVARRLTDEGRSAALKLRETLELQGVEFVAVGASPVIRAVETAAIMAHRPTDRVTPIRALIPPDSRRGGDASRINFLYDNIGDAPLRGYRTLPGDDRVMDAYGARTWNAVRRFLRASPPGDILIVGHAVLTQAILFAAIKGTKTHQQAMRTKILDYILLQGGGLRVHLEDQIPLSVEPDDGA